MKRREEDGKNNSVEKKSTVSIYRCVVSGGSVEGGGRMKRERKVEKLLLCRGKKV